MEKLNEYCLYFDMLGYHEQRFLKPPTLAFFIMPLKNKYYWKKGESILIIL